MKILIKPLIASALVIATAGVNAQSYSGDEVKDLIHEMDDNGNRSVNFQEFFEDSVTDNNDSFDVNKDGYITAGEVVLEIKEDLVQTIKELRKQGVSEKNINKTIANEFATAEAEAEKIIKRLDADGDNLVEPEELKAFKRRQFRAMDRNRDGVISKDDIKKLRKSKTKTKSKGWPIQQ